MKSILHLIVYPHFNPNGNAIGKQWQLIIK